MPELLYLICVAPLYYHRITTIAIPNLLHFITFSSKTATTEQSAPSPARRAGFAFEGVLQRGMFTVGATLAVARRCFFNMNERYGELVHSARSPYLVLVFRSLLPGVRSDMNERYGDLVQPARSPYLLLVFRSLPPGDRKGRPYGQFFSDHSDSGHSASFSSRRA